MWLMWLIGALACLIIEAIIVDLTCAMFAGGAFIAMLVSFASDNIAIQIISFALSSCLFLFLIRPWAKKYINVQGRKAGNVYALVGAAGIALTAITHLEGRVKIGGDEWSARTISGEIPEGARVVVVSIEGATAVVSRAHTDIHEEGESSPTPPSS